MTIKISNIINPVKIIELKGAKIHLRGTSVLDEGFIESIKYKRYTAQEDAERAGSIYISRVIRHCVKKVEGIVLVDSKTGEEKPFVIEFEEDGRQITLESYTILLRALNSESILNDILEFYNESKDVSLKGVEIKKKATEEPTE